MQHGACTDVICNEGYTALEAAVLHKNREIVDYLLTQGAQVNFINPKVGTSPLLLAVQEDDLETTRLFLQNGALVNIHAHDGVTPLFWAAQNGNTQIVELLLNVDGIDVNAKRDTGATALHVACQMGHFHATEIILKKGTAVEINATTHQKGRTPLFHACQAGHAAIVALLLMHGADPNLCDSEGMLHCCLHNSSSHSLDFKTILLSLSPSLFPQLPHAYVLSSRTPLHSVNKQGKYQECRGIREPKTYVSCH